MIRGRWREVGEEKGPEKLIWIVVLCHRLWWCLDSAAKSEIMLYHHCAKSKLTSLKSVSLALMLAG